MCQHRLGQDALALASYQRAAAPTLADAWSNAAQVLARLQRHAEAIEHAERAVQLDPRHAVAARTLGVVLAGAKRHAEARPWLARAQQLDPQDTVASSNLLAADQALCDWDAVDADLAALRTQWRQGRLEGGALVPVGLPVDGAELRQVTEAVSALRFPGPEAMRQRRAGARSSASRAPSACASAISPATFTSTPPAF
jgi:tetratricopeptide (TPR) repeat protein